MKPKKFNAQRTMGVCERRDKIWLNVIFFREKYKGLKRTLPCRPASKAARDFSARKCVSLTLNEESYRREFTVPQFLTLRCKNYDVVPWTTLL